jgi:hypothetical protein
MNVRDEGSLRMPFFHLQFGCPGPSDTAIPILLRPRPLLGRYIACVSNQNGDSPG